VHGRLLAGLAALALLAAAPADATIPSGNLVVNPGAEAGPGAPDDATQLPLPGWTVESTFTAVQYGATGGFPTASDSGGLGGGANFFAGGPGGAVGAATQVIDVSGAAPEIDGGKVSATLTALLGGFGTQEDSATVIATFLNGVGGPLGNVTLPPVAAADRNSSTGFVGRNATGAVPAGTRQISVRIQATRVEGSYNDGYIDNVALTLGSGAGPVFNKTVVVKVVSGKVGIRRPGSKKDVDLKGSEGIPMGSIVDTGEGVVALTSLAKAGGTPQTAKFYQGVFKVTQSGSVTNLTLTDPLASCRGARAGAAAAKKKTRHLWGDGKGSFRTNGKYSSATVRGTKWLVQDSCSGTLTRVVRGTVAVRDNVRHKTVTVKAGKSYLARPRR
jgi:hypothetical protein